MTVREDAGDSVSSDWYRQVRDLTLRLVRVRSVSPGEGESQLANAIVQMLSEDGLALRYGEVGLDPVEGDPFGRSNAYAFLEGSSKRTVILLGHFDTVDTVDYGELEPWALDPPGLAERQEQLAALAPDLRDDLEAFPGDWMLGRGAIDMKSGLAANIAVLRRLAVDAGPGRCPLSVVFLATPDEENESAGVLQAVRFLLRLRERRGLEYAGAINTDYTTSLYPGDPHRYIYTGTIGKLLPSFYIVGRESHVGAPFQGLDANLVAAELIRDLSMADDLCDSIRGQVTPPPVTLHASDLKPHYDVQLPFTAYFYLNVLTFTSSPEDLLLRLRRRAETALARVLRRVDRAERRWLAAGSNQERPVSAARRTGQVLTYMELREVAVAAAGEDGVAAALREEWERQPLTADKRIRSLALVERLWRLSGLLGPAVVVYFSPPFYPHVKASPSALHEAVAEVATEHPELPLEMCEYFPFLSDMSYLRLDSDIETSALTTNMPLWQAPGELGYPGAYSLPLEAIRQLDLPVVNLGPYGRGAHQRGERALMSYSFGVLPQLVYETIMKLATAREASR